MILTDQIRDTRIENISNCYFVHHKSQMDSYDIELWPPMLEAGDKHHNNGTNLQIMQLYVIKRSVNAFAKLRKATINIFMSVCPYGTIRLSLEGFKPLTTVLPVYRTGVPLPSKCCILDLFSTNIGTEFFKHAALSPFFSSKCRLFHNATFFISCIIHILHTGCAKI
jgi:hypothetical protein